MRLIIFLLAIALIGPVQASTIEAYPFENSTQEEQYKILIDELRCLVCQNQNLADSNAELAQDMRRKTYELVSAGKSKQEVVDYMVQRYGDFVMYKPPVQTNTLLLWTGPFIIFVVGLIVLARFVRRKPAPEDAALSAEDRARAERLLGEEEEQ